MVFHESFNIMNLILSLLSGLLHVRSGITWKVTSTLNHSVISVFDVS